MKRIYTEQELTDVIKVVFEQELQSGAFDSLISDAVDAYLEEHPVDITALEGQTINPARIDVANINGETSPSVKPIYWHGLSLEVDDGDGTEGLFQAVVLNNTPDYIDTLAKFRAWIEGIDGLVDVNLSGYYLDATYNLKGVPYKLRKNADNTYRLYYFHGTNSITIDFDIDTITQVWDAQNKIN